MSRSNVHLVVLLHGMWGNPSHLAELARVVNEKKGGQVVDGAELEILAAQANQEDSTYDGIDYGGERVAEEVEAKVKELESSGRRVTKFSMIGYSLGGLIGRYVIGILYQKGMFDTMKPMNFTTIASPHIGLIRYRNFFSTLSSKLGPTLLSRTGEQFFSADRYTADGHSLLEVMADPDRIFYRALSLFPNIRIYANAVNDNTVAYPTAMIEAADPFVDLETKGIEIVMDPDYEPIMKSYRIYDLQDSKPKPKSKFSVKGFLQNINPKNVLPPELHFPFPLNLVSYTLLPVLLPTLVVLVISRLSLSARSSRSRVKLLEKKIGASRRMELYDIVASMEQEIEHVALDVVDAITSSEPGASAIVRPTQGSPSSEETLPTSVNTASSQYKLKSNDYDPSSSSAAPIFTDGQLRMIESLNALPNLQKFVAYMKHIRRSHATIIVRDPDAHSYHRYGEGVLRHVADAFVL